jgi:hypothetical protein
LDIGQAHWIDAVALNALELAGASLCDQEMHWLATLRAGRRGGFLGMTLTLDQARALPISLSPVNAEDGAAMAKV